MKSSHEHTWTPTSDEQVIEARHLECVLSSIRQYAQEHGLTHEQVRDIFHLGLQARAMRSGYTSTTPPGKAPTGSTRTRRTAPAADT